MVVNEKLFGFTVKRIRPLEELNGELIEMTHNKTGLELVWLKREEENKTFGIAFETLPFDDTGVFHILEHSVLCGSDRYPVKEPFVELLKTSMNTFLNALTFPDKTLYPISSRNEKDFFNLMRVYLDAVFCPLIYSKPEIFEQEGWHYELDDNGNINYKGVVFNEMKGALASADELGEIALNRALFPDSPYKYVSGGEPISIPDLTYEQFIDSHKRFYSPSNAYVFLDGSVDIVKALEIIENEYLADAECGERLAPPAMQKAVDGGVTEVRYELGEDESSENKTRIMWADVIGSFDERERLIAMQVLSDVLCGSNQSILTKAVLASGLAEDVSMQPYDGILQPWIKIEAQNIADGKEDDVEELIFGELEKLVNNGIEPSQLEASMANLEFQLRERDFGSMPQGIIFNFIALETWLYGGDPIKNLQIGDVFTSLKNKMNGGYFEKLIKEILISNPHRAKVVLKPSRTVGEERRAMEQSRINSEVALWDDGRKNEVLAMQKSLAEWQNSVDSDTALATLPKLELADILPKPEELPTEINKADGITTLYHDINCAGIANISLYFDADNLTEGEISELSYLTDILGKMKTSSHSAYELDRLNRLLFGSLDFSVAAYPVENEPEKCKIKLAVSFGTLEKNANKAINHVCELLTDTQLDDEEMALDIFKQLSTKYFQQFVMAGASVAMGRISAQSTACGVVNEYAGGLEYYKWLRSRQDSWSWSELKTRLKALLDRVVCSDGLTLSLTGGNRDMLNECASLINNKIKRGSNKKQPSSAVKPWGKRKEGVVIPADISFACAGGLMPDFNSYNGEMSVASRIIALAYLWNVVRVQGGAYGTGFNINRNGLAVTYSYRDPSAKSSLEAYNGMSSFLEQFCSSTDDLTGFVIGSVAAASPLLTPKMKGVKANQNYFSGITDSDRERLIADMLGATNENIAAYADKIKDVFDNCGICVFGGREQLDKLDLESIEAI